MALGLLGGVAFAGASPAQKCTAAKLNAAGKKTAAKTNCHAKAIAKGVSVDPACLTKAETKFTAAYAKAEVIGGCPTTGDAAAVEGQVDTCVANLLGAISGAAKCAGAKVKAAGKKVAAKATCERKAILTGTAVDPACLTKVEMRFTAAVAKADAAGPCAGTAVAIEALVDACVATLGQSGPVFPCNLIANPGADDGAGASDGGIVAVPGWSAVSGLAAITAVPYGAPGGFPLASSPGPADRGVNFFAGGPSGSAALTQTYAVPGPLATVLDGGTTGYTLGGWFGGYQTQADDAFLTVDFLNGVGGAVGTATVGHVTPADRGNATGLLQRSTAGTVPSGTRSIRLGLSAPTGPYNDGYADSLSLQLSLPGCTGEATTSTMTTTTTTTTVPAIGCCDLTDPGIPGGPLCLAPVTPGGCPVSDATFHPGFVCDGVSGRCAATRSGAGTCCQGIDSNGFCYEQAQTPAACTIGTFFETFSTLPGGACDAGTGRCDNYHPGCCQIALAGSQACASGPQRAADLAAGCAAAGVELMTAGGSVVFNYDSTCNGSTGLCTSIGPRYAGACCQFPGIGGSACAEAPASDGFFDLLCTGDYPLLGGTYHVGQTCNANTGTCQ